MKHPASCSHPIAPRPRRQGDRATCLYRDCDVDRTSWTDGRIPGPASVRGRAALAPSFLVDDELARAIHHESAAALRTVGRERLRGSGAGGRRSASAGWEARLCLARACRCPGWGDAMKAKEWNDEEMDERSRLPSSGTSGPLAQG